MFRFNDYEEILATLREIGFLRKPEIIRRDNHRIWIPTRL